MRRSSLCTTTVIGGQALSRAQHDAFGLRQPITVGSEGDTGKRQGGENSPGKRRSSFEQTSTSRQLSQIISVRSLLGDVHPSHRLWGQTQEPRALSRSLTLDTTLGSFQHIATSRL